MTAAFDVPIAPHYNWDIHAQLVATIPNGIFVEYFVRGSDVKVFDEVLVRSSKLAPFDRLIWPPWQLRDETIPEWTGEANWHYSKRSGRGIR